jgi:hypothetical protein
VIDEEVERILRDEETRTRTTLGEHRAGLVAVAEALLARETVDGDEVSQLVDEAMGRKVGGPRMVTTAGGTEVAVPPPGEGDSLTDLAD